MNNAVINFLFNSQGALKELDNFKNNFTKSIDAISNSSIGKLGRIGAVLGSVFSVKSAVDRTKKIKDFINIYDQLPLDKVNQFANSIGLMNGNLSEGTSEALDYIGQLQDAISGLARNEGMFADRRLQSILAEVGGKELQISVNDTPFTAIEKIRKLFTSGKLKKEQEQYIFNALGMGKNPDLYQYFKQSEKDWQRINNLASKMGGVSGLDVDAVKKWNESIAQLQGSFERFGRTLIDQNLPGVIDKITSSLNWFASQDTQTQNVIMGIVASLLFASPILRNVIEIFRGLAGIVSSAFSLFKGLFLLLASPFGILITLGGLVWALSTNFMGCSDAIDEALDSFQNYIDELRKDKPFLASVLQQLEDFGRAVGHPIETLSESWEGIKTGDAPEVVHARRLKQKQEEEKAKKEAEASKQATSESENTTNIKAYLEKGEKWVKNAFSQYDTNKMQNEAGYYAKNVEKLNMPSEVTDNRKFIVYYYGKNDKEVMKEIKDTVKTYGFDESIVNQIPNGGYAYNGVK